MKHKQQINDLLDSLTPENQLAAVALMQKKLDWPLDKALIYIYHHHWDDNSDELILNLGKTKAVYILDIDAEDDPILSPKREWEVCLFFQLKYENEVIQKDIIVEESIPFEEDRDLKDYKAPIQEHFKGALPLIMQYLNA
ncbi:MAG: hypothetical protein GY810_16375 [Aureispira sp.]|nr:hypothetical protein [Aureispira sp.]